MTRLGQFSSKTTLNHLFVITILIILPLISSSLLNKTHNGSGLILPLIPPTSPDSPYYAQVLEANNISLSTTLNNVPLNRSHYIKWLKTLFPSPTSATCVGDNKYATVTYNKFGAGYSTNIYIGKPPQLVSGIFDTGSDVIWFQCQGNPNKPPNFDQSKSTTFKSILCSDKDKCDSSTSAEVMCGARNNCEFKGDYTDKTHVVGDMGTDIALTTLEGESLAAPELMFGCTDNNPMKFIKGVIGAGISKYSLPMQIIPDDQKFSYCFSYIMNRNYEIRFGNEASLLGPSTELVRNKLLPYYFLDVNGIKVQGTPISIPSYEYEMAQDGSRGFIIDSGTTLSYLTTAVYDGVKAELEKLLGVPDKHWIFDICYPLSRFVKMRVRYKPAITIVFREFELVLSLEGTWMEQDGPDKYQCLQIRRAIDSYSILGNHQLWDVNVGHDLTNNKLYLTRNNCPRL